VGYELTDLMDSEVDVDYSQYHQDSLNSDGSREYAALPNKTARFQQESSPDSSEPSRPSRGYKPSAQALLNVPDRAMTTRARGAVPPPHRPN
jgi:hypothetical protein